MAPELREHILIIKHGALGDIILASGHFKAIREHHPDAHITCLTGEGYVGLLSNCPFIDEVWGDNKPKPYHVIRWLALRTLLRSRRFVRVYDLQTSTRSSHYFRFLPVPKPEWSGIGAHISHPQTGDARHGMHTTARLNDQLRIAGITTDGKPDITWLRGDISHFLPQITADFALLVPGGAAHRPEKRWPAEYYGELANRLYTRGITPVLIGGEAERTVLDTITTIAPRSVNLCAGTSIAQIASLARLARWAIGNDTGPMHIIASADCPSTVIFSHASNPEKSSPHGINVTCLREAVLLNLLPDTVWATRPAGLDS